MNVHWNQVAWPSLSHRSLHRAGTTLSPYHWCASSWTMIGSYERGRRPNAPNSDSDCVSSAKGNPASETSEP